TIRTVIKVVSVYDIHEIYPTIVQKIGMQGDPQHTMIAPKSHFIGNIDNGTAANLMIGHFPQFAILRPHVGNFSTSMDHPDRVRYLICDRLQKKSLRQGL